MSNRVLKSAMSFWANCLKNYRTPEDLLGSEGIIKQLTKHAIERIMNAEMNYHKDADENTESGRGACEV